MRVQRILIANRGEIARRVIRTTRRLGIKSCAVYSEADSHSLHKEEADLAIPLGGNESGESYLRIDKIIEAAKASGSDAIHPGYGFLSENAAFAKACHDAGIIFIGPSPEVISLLGDKIKSKELAEKARVPIVPGITVDGTDVKGASQGIREFVKSVGLPVLVKAASGGGGRGMRKIFTDSDIEPAVEGAVREAKSSFSDGRIFVEKLITEARHIEVQIFGDQHGEVFHLLDRDCSMQRSHQKVIEEAPAPNLPEDIRTKMHQAAIELCKAAGYVGAGTVEFLYKEGEFYFLEVNSRLQVEHPVTEIITGLDLVELQIRIAEGEKLSVLIPPRSIPSSSQKSAIEVRICAESPEDGFSPSAGRLLNLSVPTEDPSVRFDTGYETGRLVPHYYDSLLGKLIVSGNSREGSVLKLRKALSEVRVLGVKTNIGFILSLVNSDEFLEGSHHIQFAEAYLSKDALPKFSPTLLGAISLAEELTSVSRGTPLDAWSRRDGFRLARRPTMERSFLDTKITAEVIDEKSIKIISPEEITVSEISRNSDLISFEIDEVTRCWTTISQGKTVWFGTELGTFQITRVEPLLKGDRARRGETVRRVASPLPGKIVDIRVIAGSKVLEGDVIAVIESMKMEHMIKAPHEAVVSEVSVKKGETVVSDDTLVKLEYQ